MSAQTWTEIPSLLVRSAVQPRSFGNLHGASSSPCSRSFTNVGTQGRESEGLADLQLALKEKQTEVHSVIDEAYADRGDVRPPGPFAC